MRPLVLSVMLAATICAANLWADVVVLNDGTRIEGDVKKAPGGWVVITPDGKSVEIAADKVKSIEVGSSKGSPDVAMSNLLSLRRSVENLSDINQIIDRYKRFIQQSKDAPSVVAEAQEDLAIWEQRLEQGLVKLGNKWIPPEERTELANRALTFADQARELVAHGRHHDADALLAQAMECDPICVPALYLRGVIQYQSNQLPPSRKSFETVNGLISDHAPTLNNIAVILWRQNALIPSLAHYEKALTAAPVNKMLLDNVAEALAALPDDQRKNKVAQNLFRKFTEQDTQLQQAMAAQGWYRWGGTWIDRAALENLKEIEKQVNEKIAVARKDYDAANTRIQEIDAQLASIDRSLRSIEANSVYRDGDGKIIRIPYPPIYYDLQNDLARLRAERAGQVVKLDAARREMNRLQSEMPQPKFTGVQQVIGAEGVPVMVLPPEPNPNPPSSMQPATSPS